MSLSWKRSGAPPVAADLGATGIRLLQLATEDATMLATAAEHPIAAEAQFSLDMHLAASSQAIASIRDNECWSGRKIIVSMPAPLVSMACVRLESDEDPTFVAQSRFPELADDLSIRVVDLPPPAEPRVPAATYCSWPCQRLLSCNTLKCCTNTALKLLASIRPQA